jgi:uncharacterized metal-binding protein YceD (DUF177 family)
MKFELGGQLEVVCDRCNSNLPIDLWDEFNLIVKVVEDPEVMNGQEDDPDIYYIGKGESHIGVANWIYEFINLSIPMYKTCSYENMDGPHCNTEAKEILKRMEAGKGKNENPLWKDLEKFRDLEN